MWGRPVLWLHPVTKEASSPAPPAAPGPVAPWPLCPTGECQGLQGPGGPTLGPLPPVGTGSSRALISVWGCFSGESEQTAGLRQVWASRGGPSSACCTCQQGRRKGPPDPGTGDTPVPCSVQAEGLPRLGGTAWVHSGCLGWGRPPARTRMGALHRAGPACSQAEDSARATRDGAGTGCLGPSLAGSGAVFTKAPAEASGQREQGRPDRPRRQSPLSSLWPF